MENQNWGKWRGKWCALYREGGGVRGAYTKSQNTCPKFLSSRAPSVWTNAWEPPLVPCWDHGFHLPFQVVEPVIKTGHLRKCQSDPHVSEFFLRIRRVSLVISQCGTGDSEKSRKGLAGSEVGFGHILCFLRVTSLNPAVLVSIIN